MRCWQIAAVGGTLACAMLRAAEPEVTHKGKTVADLTGELRAEVSGSRETAVLGLQIIATKACRADPTYHLPPDTQKELARLIREDPDEFVRLYASQLFDRMGGIVCEGVPRPDWVPEVTRSLHAARGDRSEKVRASAVLAIAWAKPTPEVIAAAASGLKDPDWMTRSNANVALRRLGPAARPLIPAVRRMMRDDVDERVRVNAAWTVWAIERDETAAVTTAIDVWVNGSPEVDGRAIVHMLAREMGPAARPLAPVLVWYLRLKLPEVEKKYPDYHRTYRANMLETLLAIDPEAARPFLPDAPNERGFPRFKVQEIETGLKIGYAVILEDLNGDGKPDIVVVDQHRVVWYENPTWKRRTILTGKTKPDNVCIAALDVDGDGQLDLVLGAGWKPSDTKTPGTLQWLKRGSSLDDEWTVYPIRCDEPTVHRVRVADLDGDGRPEILLAPLMGREATAKANWTDGRPVRLLAYKVPKDPTRPEAWTPEVVADELHVVHNVFPERAGDILAASYEGVSRIARAGGAWRTTRIGEGNQANPKANRGASEVKAGRTGGGPVIATIEPWHGNQVVVYTPPGGGNGLWHRHVLDDHLRWGHAVWLADLDGDGTDELVIGVRDDPNPKLGDTFTERRGVRVYKCADGKGEKWDRFILEGGGVAVEDLAVADLDGDGRPDIVAVGRQTGNARIYWNRGK